MTFHHGLDPLFVIAIDDKGRHYRVLLATGRPEAHYRLEPWVPGNKVATHRGMWIDEGHPLHDEVEAAEKVRRDNLPPLTERQRKRIEWVEI